MSQTTWVYRYWDEGYRLLYVGMTNYPDRRDAQHEATQPWYSDVEYYAKEPFPSREWAAREEMRAIALELPIHNIARPRSPVEDRWQRAVQGEPRLKALHAGVVRFVGSFDYCWQDIDWLVGEVRRLVGWYREDDGEDFLFAHDTYDAVYHWLRRLMPECIECGHCGAGFYEINDWRSLGEGDTA